MKITHKESKSMFPKFSTILIIFVMFCVTVPVFAQTGSNVDAQNISGSTEGEALPTEEIVLPVEYDNLVDEEIVSEEAIVDNEITAEDLGVSANVQTTSRWRRWWQNTKQAVSLATTFNATKAVEKRFQYANEKVAKAKHIIENSDNDKLKNKAVKDIEKAHKYITNIKSKLETLKIRPEKLEELQDKFSHQQYLHHKILEKLENQVPEKNYEKIKAARERHLENMKEIMEKVDNNDPEKMAARLRRTFEKKQGSDLKPLNDLEFIDKLKEKFSDKESFKKAITERHRALAEKMKNIELRERAEKLKNYISHVQDEKGELKEKLLERRHKILEQAGKAKELSNRLKGTITTAKNETRRRIQNAKDLKAKKEVLNKKAEAGDNEARELLDKIGQKKDILEKEKERRVYEIRKQKQMLPAYDETKWDPKKKEVKPNIEARFNPKEIDIQKTEPYDGGQATGNNSPNKEFTNSAPNVMPKAEVKVQPVQQGPGLIKIKPKTEMLPKSDVGSTPPPKPAPKSPGSGSKDSGGGKTTPAPKDTPKTGN